MLRLVDNFDLWQVGFAILFFFFFFFFCHRITPLEATKERQQKVALPSICGIRNIVFGELICCRCTSSNLRYPHCPCFVRSFHLTLRHMLAKCATTALGLYASIRVVAQSAGNGMAYQLGIVRTSTTQEFFGV